MNIEERESLVDRICKGYYWETVIYNEQEYEVEFRDPPRTFIYNAKQKAKKFFRNRKDLLSQQQVDDLRIERGVWSFEKQANLDQLESDLKIYKEELSRVEFNESRANWVKNNISAIKTKMSDLLRDKNQFIELSLEYQKDLFVKRWLMENTYSFIGDGEKPPQSEGFLNTLVLYYWEKNFPKEGQFRELARTEPWRLIWTASKDTSTPLFSHPISDITELQQVLISWTRVYDWAFEHPERPSRDVINDDDKFDAWYSEQEEKNKKDTQEKQFKHKKGDVFIPSDANGSRKVWSMNDIQTRNKIKNRLQYVEKNGEVSEGALPDVKMDLLMEANRQNFASHRGK